MVNRKEQLIMYSWISYFFILSRTKLTLLRTKNVPSLVKIHWRMLILECSQGCYVVKIDPVTLTYPCEHSRINILQWILTKRGTYLVLTRVWNPIDFQGQRSRSQGEICLVKIHWRMLILVFTRTLCSKNFTRWHWPLTLKWINFIRGIPIFVKFTDSIKPRNHQINECVSPYIYIYIYICIYIDYSSEGIHENTIFTIMIDNLPKHAKSRIEIKQGQRKAWCIPSPKN
jgi:hypothetical protein